ncbi:MAG: ATP-binding protein [Solobacterium sp.]|jgi:two-component system phosphate regulon sensor histidine kinase PhoR|nr:ATP-binding protein [Solobacterium sp.]MCH4048194.1 ATP-binding protein [Solobacterium sp.]MCH4074952.1 ATP-binding protein [Solobacterium sp.]MCI1314401.1 ATP-binding protein [Solobacterium sp.]MCI1346578.1 ATP-binding protein [Solobacterium sp.]
MRKKIFRTVALTMAVILAIAMVIVILIVNHHFITVEENRMDTEAQLAAEGVAYGGENYLKSLAPHSYRLTWIDQDGSVLYDSQADPATMENHKDRTEVKEAFTDGTGEDVRYSDTLAERTIYYAVKCDDGTVVRIAETYDTVGILTLRMVSPMLVLLILSILSSSLIANKLSKDLAKPINEVDLDHPLAQTTYEEITPLLTRIDKQNRQIDEQMEQLHQRKKEFEAVTKNINEGLILINMKQEILSVNEAALDLFDLDEKPKKITDFTDDPKFAGLISDVMHNYGAEVILKTSDITLRADANPIRSHGVQTGASILVQDVTENYAAEEVRRQFTANVSHELKTPLQSIMGYSELMENHLVDPKDCDSFAHKIHTESCRMLQLIDDIIRLSQLDEGNVVDVNALNLKDLVNEAAEAVSAEAKEHQVELKFDIESVWINANSRLIYEIIYNLMDNAIRYNRAGGYVKVKTRRKHDEAVLEVSDNGIGIPRESLPHIFERFYRVDKSHSRATGGTGLGLSIVKHAVQLSHGRITVQSKINQGTTFTARFPAVQK